MLSCFSHIRLFATPWTVARQAPLSMGLSRQEYWNGLPCPPPGYIPKLRIKPTPFMPPALPGELLYHSVQFRSVQSCPTLCDPMDRACQASLPTTNSQSLPKLMSIELMMPSNQTILCRPLLLLPSIFPSISFFSNESALHIRWPKSSASASVLPMNIQDGFPLRWTGWISLQSKGLSRVFSNTRVQKHKFSGAQLSL